VRTAERPIGAEDAAVAPKPKVKGMGTACSTKASCAEGLDCCATGFPRAPPSASRSIDGSSRQRTGDRRHQLFDRYGLHEVVGEIVRSAAAAIAFLPIASECNEAATVETWLRAKPLGELVSIHDRQTDVENRHLGRNALRLVERFDRIVGHLDVVAAEAKRIGQKVSRVDVVADLVLASQSDWRLPSVGELLSLVDYSSAASGDVLTGSARRVSGQFRAAADSLARWMAAAEVTHSSPKRRPPSTRLTNDALSSE
jgi:hypothetical protein